MTATLTTVPSSTVAPASTEARTSSLWKAGLAAGVAAAAATTAVAAVAKAQDVEILTKHGDAIPLAGFAQMTLLFTVVGILLARSLRRRAAQPRRTLEITTVALTALSFVPDLLLSTDAASKATLMLTHAVAAAIVIPVLVGRMPERRSATAS
jgi:peptidoglycan/LPS O-acetylase OafA/YrhL